MCHKDEFTIYFWPSRHLLMTSLPQKKKKTIIQIDVFLSFYIFKVSTYLIFFSNIVSKSTYWCNVIYILSMFTKEAYGHLRAISLMICSLMIDDFSVTMECCSWFLLQVQKWYCSSYHLVIWSNTDGIFLVFFPHDCENFC